MISPCSSQVAVQNTKSGTPRSLRSSTVPPCTAFLHSVLKPVQARRESDASLVALSLSLSLRHPRLFHSLCHFTHLNHTSSPHKPLPPAQGSVDPTVLAPTPRFHRDATKETRRYIIPTRTHSRRFSSLVTVPTSTA